MLMHVCDLTGISLGNLPNIIDIHKSDGWTVIELGCEIWAFRMAAVSE